MSGTPRSAKAFLIDNSTTREDKKKGAMGGVLCFSQISFQSAHGVVSRIDLAFVSVTERFPGAEPQGSGPRQEPSYNSACKRTQHSDRSEHQSPRSPIYFDFAMGSAMYSRKRPNRGSNVNESVIGQKNV